MLWASKASDNGGKCALVLEKTEDTGICWNDKWKGILVTRKTEAKIGRYEILGVFEKYVAHLLSNQTPFFGFPLGNHSGLPLHSQ